MLVPNKRNFKWVVLAGLGGLMAHCMGESVFTESFEQGTGDFSAGKVVASDERKGNALLHKGGAIWIWCENLKPGVKYKLSFWAKSDSENVIEESPLIKKAFYDHDRKNKGLVLPEWSISYYDEQKKFKQSPILYSYYKVIYSNKWKKYEDVFFPAPGSSGAKIVFFNNSQANLYLDDVSLETIEESALNINPEFKYGEYNHCGYGMSGWDSSVEIVKRSDSDKYDLMVPTWINTDPMPVTGGENYVVHVKLAPDTSCGARVNVSFLDDNLKDIKCRTLPVPLAEGEGKANFIAPENAKWLKMLIYGKKGLKFESIKVTEVPLKAEK